MKNLDQSHRTVLTNYETYQRVLRCHEEIEAYLWDVVRELKGEFDARSDSSLKWTLNEDEWWIQADAFPTWDTTKYYLMGIGVEHISIEKIIPPDISDGCYAYVYVHPLANQKVASEFPWLKSRFRAVEPPKGFGFGTQEGYVFKKPLGSLSVESFCSRTELKSYLQNPLNDLVEWFERAAPVIATFKKQGRKSSSAK